MKWMGWNWYDLRTTPHHIVSKVIQMINEEAEKD